ARVFVVGGRPRRGVAIGELDAPALPGRLLPARPRRRRHAGGLPVGDRAGRPGDRSTPQPGGTPDPRGRAPRAQAPGRVLVSGSRVVVVLGGDLDSRSSTVADIIRAHGGTALVLTGHPGSVDRRLDTGDDGPVEVRPDDPAARLSSFVAGSVDADDEVLAALALGGDGVLASVLGWEYARRAAAAQAWDLVVVELDGDLAGVRMIAAAGELAAFVESRWPAHVRFASMAAGDRADARLREAHRLSQLASDVSAFLAGMVEVVVAGATPHRTAALADLVRGAVAPVVAEDGHGGFRAELAVPAHPTTPVTVDGGRLRPEFDGVRAALPLPALLARCTLVDSTYDDHRGVVVVGFAPDPDLWPSHLVPAGSTRQPG